VKNTWDWHEGVPSREHEKYIGPDEVLITREENDAVLLFLDALMAQCKTEKGMQSCLDCMHRLAEAAEKLKEAWEK
jgi:hypothetical protein